MTTRAIRMGMVGGGRDAFIGAVHRMAARLDDTMTLVAGALSSSPEKAVASGRDLGLAESRNYRSWRDMLEGERRLPAAERIEAVSIVTPNDQHHPVAKAFAEAGFHVVLDKPMTRTTAEARDLTATVAKSGTVLAVTYNYSGYPLVKQAREMAAAGELGEIRKVIVEYNQGWLATALESTGQKQADWRTDPARAGLGGAIGDIGSHAEHLLRCVTGLKMESLCADLTSFIPGRRVDDDANVLLRFSGGARGILTASQVCTGQENNLRLRVFGSKAGLEWWQEEPNRLTVYPEGQPERVYRRGNAYLGSPARTNSRIPPGHPEAFIEAFANIYRAAAAHMRAVQGSGSKAGVSNGGFDYPTVQDGAAGVHFIERVVESSRSDVKWLDARFDS